MRTFLLINMAGKRRDLEPQPLVQSHSQRRLPLLHAAGRPLAALTPSPAGLQPGCPEERTKVQT